MQMLKSPYKWSFDGLCHKHFCRAAKWAVKISHRLYEKGRGVSYKRDTFLYNKKQEYS